MHIPQPYSLQSKFILRLIVILMLISVINLTGLYYFMQNTVDEEVSTRATIVLKQVDAIQKYIQTRLRPKMIEILPDNFIVEAMSSSYVSRSIMETVDIADADYLYRRVAINARNPVFEANAIERDLISYFQQNPSKDIWQGLKNIEERKVFVMARPVKFIQSCMLCHGQSAVAPVELIRQYGGRGFNHALNTIGGVDLVGIPTDRYAVKSMSQFTLYVLVYLIISVLVLVLIYASFQRVVVVNLRTLSSQFRKNLHDQKGVELLSKVEHGDEIEEMIDNMEGLSQHLYETDQRLKEYAGNLEKEVDRRTEQLSLENETHKKDLGILVRVLGALKNSRNRPELWRNVLPLLAKRFTLVRVSYICTFSGNQDFTWPQDAKPPALPKDHVTLLLQPQLRYMENAVFIPVGSSDDNIEGLLYLERPGDLYFTDNDTEILTAVGRQLGIAAENLSALDSLLNQTQNLQTIFEGVPDPLLLLDHGGAVIVANNAANHLIDELSRQEANNDHDPNDISRLLKADISDEQGLNPARHLAPLVTREVELTNGRSFIINTIGLAQQEKWATRYVVAIQEDTEKKKMLRQFVQAEKMATVGKLAAGLAHELNNPLGVILCYAELLQKSLGSDQQQTDIDVIIKHTRQAQVVLLDLLNFARPKVATHLDTVLGDVTESVISVFRIQAAKKGVSLSCRRDDGRMTVRVEPQVVEHIILNLLLNALDSLPESGGEIAVHLFPDRHKRGLRLRVSDNGSGIDPAILPSVFDPFFTTKDVNKGYGLGLAVIYGYMRELAGTINARNLPGGGAVFDLYFPSAHNL